MPTTSRIADRRRAFTLVELLVVIGIIALLISILLPALNKARESAKGLQCMSNHRQLVAGILMYAEDSHGMFPATYPMFKAGALLPNNAWVPWYGQPLVGQYIGNTHTCSTADSPTNQKPSTNIVYCPSVLGFSRNSQDIGIGYNNSRENYLNRYDLSWPDWAGNTLRKLGTLKWPSKVILTVDTDSVNGSGTFQWNRYYNGQTGLITGNDNFNTGYAAYRHNGQCTVGFADGHVDMVRSTYPNVSTDTTSGLYKAYLEKQVTQSAYGN